MPTIAPLRVDPEPGAILSRATTGARLLTARGIGMRLVSIGSNLVLIALVTPADLGLLAVVRGLTALAGNTTDLGFGWALLRRPRDPSLAEYGALAGVQAVMVAAIIALVGFAPAVLGTVGAVPPRWHRWTEVLLATTLLVPFGTSAKIRLERRLDYRRIAFLDLSSVLLLNAALLGFAIAGRFSLGVFVATGAGIVYTNLLLWIWSPGPGPRFRLSVWRGLAREFAGFSLGHLCYVLYSSATPIVVANLFGLAGAGIWSFAGRVGNLLQVAFEGFRRAAVPAAAKLVEHRDSLRRLVEASLLGASRLTVPLVAAAYATLPLVGLIWPRWRPAIVLAQLYALGFGIAGMISASLVPAAVALRGAAAVLGEQIAPMAVGWILLAILAGRGSAAIAWAVIPMFSALVLTLWLLTDRSVRPRWTPALGRLTLGLTLVVATTILGQSVGAAPLPIAMLAAVLYAAVHLGGRRLEARPSAAPAAARSEAS